MYAWWIWVKTAQEYHTKAPDHRSPPGLLWHEANPGDGIPEVTFLPPPSPSFPHILSICYFAKSFKTLVTASRHTISQLKRLHMRRPEVPKRKGEGEKSYKKKYIAYLVTLGSVWKVKCFMFRNTWADSCCSSSCLINFSYFSSSSEASVIPLVNLWNKY